jgi:hypothetical protein
MGNVPVYIYVVGGIIATLAMGLIYWSNMTMKDVPVEMWRNKVWRNGVLFGINATILAFNVINIGHYLYHHAL